MPVGPPGAEHDWPPTDRRIDRRPTAEPTADQPLMGRRPPKMMGRRPPKMMGRRPSKMRGRRQPKMMGRRPPAAEHDGPPAAKHERQLTLRQVDPTTGRPPQHTDPTTDPTTGAGDIFWQKIGHNRFENPHLSPAWPHPPTESRGMALSADDLRMNQSLVSLAPFAPSHPLSHSKVQASAPSGVYPCKP